MNTKFNVANIPPELIRLGKFSVWDGETKAPRMPEGDGPHAKNNDESTWADWNTCVEFAKKRGWGIGLQMGSLEGILALDLDNAIGTTWGDEIVKRAQSYTERTPSGRGLRIFVRGHFPFKNRMYESWSHPSGEKHTGFSIHRQGYVTLTGDRDQLVPGAIMENQPFLDWLQQTYFPKLGKRDPKPLKSDFPEILPTLSLDEVAMVNEVCSQFILAKYASRSEHQFACSRQLKNGGLSDDKHVSALLDERCTISRAILTLSSGKARPHARRYAEAQVRHLNEKTERPNDYQDTEDALNEMNLNHAVVQDWGGKCRVLTESEDRGRRVLSISTFEDVRNAFYNQWVETVDSEGEIKFSRKGEWWLGNAKRRQYRTISFAPEKQLETDVYNLYRGFAVAPRPGDCDLFLEHLRINVCDDNPLWYDYLWKWFANMVQKPWEQGHTAIVLRGKRGVGKSFVTETFGRLFGQHFMLVSNADQVVGKFNGHLQDVILLGSEEAFWAGSKTGESALKTLITSPVLTFESKFASPISGPNCLHLVVTSNEDWVVPAGIDERRFFVLEVRPDHINDHAYFQAISDQMNAGGYEALLYKLQQTDLRGFNVRSMPLTSGLSFQKEMSLDPRHAPVPRWFLEALRSGELETGVDGRTGTPIVMYVPWKEGCVFVGTKGLVRQIGDHATGNAVRDLFTKMQFECRAPTTQNAHHLPTGWILPPLDECRARWDLICFPVLWDRSIVTWDVERVTREPAF